MKARKDSRQDLDRDHFSLALKHLNFSLSPDITFKRWRRGSQREDINHTEKALTID